MVFVVTKPFDRVVRAASALTDVEVATRYDGATVLKARGCFMAGIATHPSAEPDSLIVRTDISERSLLLEDAPDTYYVTDYYQPHPVVLVRLAAIDEDALREVVSISWRLTMTKARGRSRTRNSARRRR